MDVARLLRGDSHYSPRDRADAPTREIRICNLHQWHRLESGRNCLHCRPGQHKLEFCMLRLRHAPRGGSPSPRTHDPHCHYGNRGHWLCHIVVLLPGSEGPMMNLPSPSQTTRRTTCAAMLLARPALAAAYTGCPRLPSHRLSSGSPRRQMMHEALACKWHGCYLHSNMISCHQWS